MSSDRKLRSQTNATSQSAPNQQTSGIPRFQQQISANSTNIPETTTRESTIPLTTDPIATTTQAQTLNSDNASNEFLQNVLISNQNSLDSNTNATNMDQMNQMISSINNLTDSFAALQTMMLQNQQVQQQLLRTISSNNQERRTSSSQSILQHPLAHTGAIPRTPLTTTVPLLNTDTRPTTVLSTLAVTSTIQTTPVTAQPVITNPVLTPIVTNPVATTTFNPWSRINVPLIKKMHTEHSFRQLEAWMTANQIIDDNNKFMTLVMAIDVDTSALVNSAIEHPPTINKYENLKGAIIRAYAESETIRMRKLISKVQLNNRKPSTMLAEMRNLYKGPTDNDIFRNIFLDRLPRIARTFLDTQLSVPNAPQLTLEQLAEQADKICENLEDNESNVNAVSSNNELMNKIDNLARELAELKSYHRSRSPNRNDNNHRQNSNSRNRSNSHRDPTPTPRVCRLHIKYGEGQHKNKRCFPKCKLYNEWLEAQKNSKN